MITEFNRDNPVKNLPDAYNKADSSNNSKILAIEKSSFDKLREAIADIDECLDLDKAYGKTLDLYGEMVGQERGKATDDQYRVLIRSRIIRNFANGDYNTVVNLMAMVFECEPSEIILSELEDDPCKARLEAIPYASANRLIIDIHTLLKIVSEVMPAGVSLESVTFTGTLEFSDGTELVYDEEAGFADEAQSIGGTFGYIFSKETSELPV